MKDSSNKVRILVVDDSPDTLEVLKRNLKAEGYTVFAALGAVEAVKSGAEEYLSKPFTDEELSSAVKRSLDKLFLRRMTETQSYRPPESRQGYPLQQCTLFSTLCSHQLRRDSRESVGKRTLREKLKKTEIPS